MLHRRRSTAPLLLLLLILCLPVGSPEKAAAGPAAEQAACSLGRHDNCHPGA